MEYKLNAEQSEEFITHMFLIDKYCSQLNTDAISIISFWYTKYCEHKKWYWLRRDFKSFLKTISFSDEIEIKHSSMGYSYLSVGDDSIWTPGFKVSRIVDLTGLSLSKVQDDVEIVWKSLEFMNKNITFIHKNYDIFNDIKMYCKSPYKIDDYYLNHKKKCSQIVNEWDLEE